MPRAARAFASQIEGPQPPPPFPAPSGNVRTSIQVAMALHPGGISIGDENALHLRLPRALRPTFRYGLHPALLTWGTRSAGASTPNRAPRDRFDMISGIAEGSCSRRGVCRRSRTRSTLPLRDTLGRCCPSRGLQHADLAQRLEHAPVIATRHFRLNAWATGLHHSRVTPTPHRAWTR